MTHDEILALAAKHSAYADCTLTLRGDAIVEFAREMKSTQADHWSDCATNNAPAYPAGTCDCMPTPAMCRAAVVYMNGPDVYEKLPREVLDIEESIYRDVWLAMQAAAPSNT